MDAEVVGEPLEMTRAPTEMWLHLVLAAEIEHPVLKKRSSMIDPISMGTTPEVNRASRSERCQTS